MVLSVVTICSKIVLNADLSKSTAWFSGSPEKEAACRGKN